MRAGFPLRGRCLPCEAGRFLSHGRILACGYDFAKIQLRRVSDGAELAKLTLPDIDRCTGLKFSPDGRYLGVLDETRVFFFDLEAIEKHLDLLGLALDTP